MAVKRWPKAGVFSLRALLCVACLPSRAKGARVRRSGRNRVGHPSPNVAGCLLQVHRGRPRPRQRPRVRSKATPYYFRNGVGLFFGFNCGEPPPVMHSGGTHTGVRGKATQCCLGTRKGAHGKAAQCCFAHGGGASATRKLSASVFPLGCSTTGNFHLPLP